MDDKKQLHNTPRLLRPAVIATTAVLGLILLLGVLNELVVADPALA